MTIELKLDNTLEIKEKVRNIPVCLIIPPSTFLADERVFPFLGILKVASQLKQNGNPLEVLDLSGYSNFPDIVAQHVKNTKAEVFGITATTPQIPAAAVIRNVIKEISPNSTLILGGPHVTLAHTGMIADRNLGRTGRATQAFGQLERLFDKLAIGDGETSIFQALIKDNSKIIDASTLSSPLFIRRGELEKYPFPDRSLIDLGSYRYYIEGKRAFSVISQLGCPFECGFCGGRDSPVFRLTRSRSNESVVKEIEEVINYGKQLGVNYEAVMFYDDELNVNRGVLENLCTQLIDLQNRLGLEMRFRGFVKAELFTEEQAKLMYQAGFRVLLSGVESGSDEILKTMKKHTSREINKLCVNHAHDAGLKFKALMSVGHPGESEKTIAESIEWVLTNLKPEFDDIDWTIITEYPGTPYFDRSVYVPEKDAWLYIEEKTENRLWSKQVDMTKETEYYKGIPGEYKAYVWTDFLTPEDLVKLRDEAERKTREYLKLPAVSAIPMLQFEHSMGQSLPENILRKVR